MRTQEEADGGVGNRLLWVVGTVVAVVAAVGVYTATTMHVPPSDDPCSAEHSVIDELWDAEARFGVHDRLEALGPTFDAADLVARVDAYKETLLWTRTDVCRRAEAEGKAFDDRSPAALCLQRRTERLAAAADMISDGELEVAQQAVAFIDALEDPAPCLDRHYTRYELPMPPTPGRLVPALVVQQRLAEVELLLAGGLKARARERIAELADAVTESGHLPSMARFELLRFKTLNDKERRHPAELSRMTDAVGVAERAGADPLAARLLVLQLEALGQGHPSAAMIEAYAEAKVVRSADALAAAALERWRGR